MGFLAFIRESFNIRNFYHTTSIDNLSSILKKGLIPGHEKPSGQDWMGLHSGKGIYLHNSLPHHELINGYDENEAVPNIVVLEVKIESNPKFFLPDEDIGLPMDENGATQALQNGEAVAYMDKIPSNKITSIYIPLRQNEENIDEYMDSIDDFVISGGKFYRYDVDNETFE